MINYKTTVVKNHPEYVGRKLLLTTTSKNQLYYNKKDDFYLELEFNTNGDLTVHKVSKEVKKIVLDYSLRRIGEKFLKLNDPSVNKMLNYLVIPEIEVERIFNNLRYKYINCIYLADFESPQERIKADYNKAFQALAGIKIYQGNTKDRKDNDFFWKSVGFKDSARIKNNFDIEKEDMKFIITYIRNLNVDNFNKIYSELISIKLGFHEIWIHKDYFEDKYNRPAKNSSKEDEREKIFRRLRGNGNLSDLYLQKLPSNVYNWYNYIRYASCSITEGPFVYRKSLYISYYDEIRKIKSKEEKVALRKYFNILDYRSANIDSKIKLKNFLNKAKEFCKFP